MTISLCMIVRNEEEVLARCLDSVAGVVDEVVIVDTGSTDATVEIARRYTDRVFFFRWIDDFAAARNFAFSKGRMDYLLWLDADDVLLESDRRALYHLKGALSPEVDVVMLPYHVAVDSRGRPVFSYYRERLLRREAGFRWIGAIHEAIVPTGNIVYETAAVTHAKLRAADPQRNLRIFEKLLARGETLDARQYFYYARELLDNGRTAEAVEQFRAFLSCGGGWVEDCIEACRALARGCFALGREEEGLEALFASFRYDMPRAETCCDIGWYFFEREQFRIAAYWYEQARAQKPDPTHGFCQPDCYGFLPCLQLCVCYDRLGDMQRAKAYNEEAGRFKPEDEAVVYNRSYFAGKSEAGQA